MNHSDSDIRDDSDDEVDGTYPDSDALAAPVDRRWRPMAVIAGSVFVLATIATAVILNGGDSASTTATVLPQPTVTATPRATTPTSSLPPETPTTVTPPHKSPPTAAPSPIPPPETSTPPPPEMSPRTFVYRVTGTKGLLDLVTIFYTDAQGIPHTDFNVSLPWSKAVALNPGVQLTSVVATSLSGRLNCVITDATGQTVVASANNSMIATCTR
jgi:hypothetical protein